MMQYFKVLLCPLHEIVPVFQALDIRFLEHILPVNSTLFGLGFQIAQYHYIGHKHGNDNEQDARNIVGVVIKCVREKAGKGKATVKKDGDQTQFPVAFSISFFLEIQAGFPDIDKQECQDCKVHGGASEQGQDNTASTNMTMAEMVPAMT